MIILLDFAKSGKGNVKDYLEAQGYTEANRPSYVSFGHFLRKQYSFDEISVARVNEYLKQKLHQQNNIQVKQLITEIEEHIHILRSLHEMQSKKTDFVEVNKILQEIAKKITIEKGVTIIKYLNSNGLTDLNGKINVLVFIRRAIGK